VENAALPFTDPATGLVYARARWLDPTTSSFLSPDPLGYKDSSNLYAYCGGDPVNCKDPTREDAYDDRLKAYIAWHGAQTAAMWEKRKELSAQIRAQRKVTSDTGELEAEDRWLARRREVVESKSSTAPEFREALNDLESILVGMGSFSDVPMYPKPGARLTRQEALTQQWDLTETLGAAIREVVGKGN
jgi:uncharacterized protein RhaS with RHS repeats